MEGSIEKAMYSSAAINTDMNEYNMDVKVSIHIKPGLNYHVHVCKARV